MATAAMQNREIAKKFFEEAMTDTANCACIECGALHPQWASVNLGTYFCLVCSGVHRSLGVHLSFVRSLTMDSWSEKQLNSMRFGGNAKCAAYLAKHGVSSGTNLQDKYNTKAAEAYRQQLKARVEGTQPPPDPAPGTGGQSYYDAPAVSAPSAPIMSNGPSDQDSWMPSAASEGFWSVLDMAKSAAGAVKETAASTVENAQRDGWVESVTNVALQGGSYVKSTATTAASWGVNQANNGMNFVSETGAYKATTTTIGGALGSVGVANRFSTGNNGDPTFTGMPQQHQQPVKLGATANNGPTATNGGAAIQKKDMWEDDDW